MEEFYQDSGQYLYDELLLVDLMVNAQVVKFRALRQNSNPMAGLYLAETEIEELLNQSPGYRKWVDSSTPVNEQYDTLATLIVNLHQQIRAKLKNSQKQGIPLKLEEMSRIYSLSSLELQIFLICLAPEFDSKYNKLFAYLQDDVTRKAPSIELVLDLLCRSFQEKTDARRYFTAQAQLFKHNLLEYIPTPTEPAKPLISRALKANERIVNYLLGDNRLDDDLYTMVRRVTTDATLDSLSLPAAICRRFRDFIRYSRESLPQNFLFAFYGPYGSEMLEVAAVVCREIGAPLLVADLEALYQAEIFFERCIDLLFRESKINWAALYFKNCDFLFDETTGNDYLKRYFLDQVDENSLLTFIASRELLPLHGEFKKQKLIAVELPLPDYPARKGLWTRNLASYKLEETVDIKEIAGKYNLSTSQIKEVVSTAGVYALWRNPASPVIGPGDLEEATHIHSNQRLGRLAQRIRPKQRWQNLILKADIKEKLQELVKMFRHKHIVYSEWEFNKKLSLGKGISALFYGEPGTGKTMAAEIIAAELGMDLYKIDISSIVSKYIGETEKNLSRIFSEAERANAILFFDEADAIFGKRTEVKDSHDRYSNIEISYLLQRIDEYNGVVIMATNFSQNIDKAFERRLHYSINFPMPDRDSRLKIWENIFPEAAPLGELDFPLLAEKLEISGGHIKNIALQAAFYAADNPGEKLISMELVKKACNAEFIKMGRLWHDNTLA